MQDSWENLQPHIMWGRDQSVNMLQTPRLKVVTTRGTALKGPVLGPEQTNHSVVQIAKGPESTT